MADIKDNHETQEASDHNVQAVQCEAQSIPLSTDSTSLTSGESVDSYRPIHSLLLCPAQWTALLESPISLVRQTSENDKDSKEVEKALDTDFAENACEQPADNIRYVDTAILELALNNCQRRKTWMVSFIL